MAIDKRRVALLDIDHQIHEQQYGDDVDESSLIRSGTVVWVFFLLIIALFIWSYLARVDEVSSGSGKVVPTSRAQIIQSLDGGILAQLKVSEGDIVEKGQVLAQLDPTKVRSNMDESSARYRAALAKVARLSAEVNQTPLRFPEELVEHEELQAKERKLFDIRKQGLLESVRGSKESLELVRRELAMTSSLVDSGAASSVDVLKLRRQKAELETKIRELNSQYMVRAREELAKVSAEVEVLASVLEGRSDTLVRLTHRSPVRGIVKAIEITTIGGVIPPNGKLMEIVPLDDQLLIEAKISPRDIAFIHPGQLAKVKITAYDYAIYGGLSGEVTMISPDTIQDEVAPNEFYYKVFILTTSDSLENGAGKKFSIVPGMIASVDIKTGSKTIFDYLMKPISRAKEAMRER
ncbi:HlyD family efflux transporter periplasmic adaptor subunit [Microbulbifer sp. MLAF003]|uniref:HlyD family efflux transporter periplasmic adaptor subunit n=1 Tax=Microbulbifer sp. MLAF003 TaxID=3032582 RepID=UPI0024AE6064|nr:HlyD family efflux transporter periplasmic adaptor subunit [Microbulbifer sp. MLAF003]WHI52383.1 HlyD family efflux transporter periplasmic adaptor subunit [Microbulbifer sp. MLAF003]